MPTFFCLSLVLVKHYESKLGGAPPQYLSRPRWVAAHFGPDQILLSKLGLHRCCCCVPRSLLQRIHCYALPRPQMTPRSVRLKKKKKKKVDKQKTTTHLSRRWETISLRFASVSLTFFPQYCILVCRTSASIRIIPTYISYVTSLLMFGLLSSIKHAVYTHTHTHTHTHLYARDFFFGFCLFLLQEHFYVTPRL